MDHSIENFLITFFRILSKKPFDQSILLSDLSVELNDRETSVQNIGTCVQFLELFGLVSVDEKDQSIKINGPTAHLCIQSFCECFQDKVILVSDWKREGVSEFYINANEVIDRGVDFLFWLESSRTRYCTKNPIKIGYVSKAIIKAKSTDGDDLVLMQRSHDSGMYQFIGGRRFNDAETPLDVMKRELRQELRGNNFHFGVNTNLFSSDLLQIDLLSPRYGCVTRWHTQYFFVTFSSEFSLQLPPDTRWTKMNEYERGYTDDLKPILSFPSNVKLKHKQLIEAAPISIKERVKIYRIELEGDEWWNKENFALSLIIDICRHFPLVASTLNKRPQKRQPLKIADEWDVQYVLNALLHLLFKDIRPEEWTPSYAGKSSRMDFYIPKHGIVVEAKMMRNSLTQKTIADQILIDIARYQEHPNCKFLVCMIFDPNYLLQNTQSIESDLSGIHGKIKVKTIITPNR